MSRIAHCRSRPSSGGAVGLEPRHLSNVCGRSGATGQRKNGNSPGRRRAFLRDASGALHGARRTPPRWGATATGISRMSLGSCGVSRGSCLDGPLPPGAAGPALGSRGACSRHDNARDRHSGDGRRHGCNKGCLEQHNRCGRSRRRHNMGASRRCDRTSDNARRPWSGLTSVEADEGAGHDR